jgi:hypothetical protein
MQGGRLELSTGKKTLQKSSLTAQNGRTAERQNGRTAEIGRYGRKMKIICSKKLILKGRDDKHEMRIFWR